MAVLWMHPSVSAVEFFLYHVSVCVARAMCFQNSFSVLACIHMQEEMFNPLYLSVLAAWDRKIWS